MSGRIYARFTVDIPGAQRYVDGEQLFRQLALALRGVELGPGAHQLILDNSGNVYVDLRPVYKAPPARQGRGQTWRNK